MSTTTAPRSRRRTPATLTQITNLQRLPTHVGRGTRVELWEAESADGVWSYERQADQAGTPWWAIHNATGMTQVFSTITKARTWTASPGAIDFLTGEARNVLEDPHARPDARLSARRALMILTGHLLPYRAGLEPDAVCVCGGYLVDRAGGMAHLDVCAGELFDQECTGTAAHAWCTRPAPKQCEHHACRAKSTTHAEPCQLGHDACCGCCHGEV